MFTHWFLTGSPMQMTQINTSQNPTPIHPKQLPSSLFSLDSDRPLKLWLCDLKHQMKHNQIQKDNATVLTISIKYVDAAVTWERKMINHLLTNDVLCLDFVLMAKCYHHMFHGNNYHSQRFQWLRHGQISQAKQVSGVIQLTEPKWKETGTKITQVQSLPTVDSGHKCCEVC